MTRNAIAAGLATAGVILFCFAALDWAGYTGFCVSLIWR